MTSRVLCVAFVFAGIACATEGSTSSSGGSSSGGSSNGGSSNGGSSGSTFCALTEITTRTCPNPARQDHLWATICEENIPDCKVLNRAGKNYEKDGCDMDVVYKLSGKNDKGPFPGTCEDYRRWDDGRDECMEAKDCLNYPNVECRNKTCYCGQERFDTEVIGKIGPAKCDGTSRTYFEGVWCEGGHIVPRPIPGEECTNGTSCVEENGSAVCKNVPPPGP